MNTEQTSENIFRYISVKFGITVKQISKIKKETSDFIQTKAFENISVNQKVKLLNEKLQN